MNFAYVQVIGELSNADQPMRRFVQSFVLAPQTANKYYVHVDIFRYQDDYVSVHDANESEEKFEEEG
jgi:Ras GTPase-activating protein-binding protein 1